jgi:regulator of sirC expression with transglutaminase-like and TPR domain
MNYNLTPLEQVNVFNHVLYGLNDFRANSQEFHDPNNCYINNLLESRKGNPISMGILYLVLASHLQMPVYGVDLPQHFILSYHNHLLQTEDNEHDVRSSILFYINAFNKGIIFSRDDITQFLVHTNHEPQPDNYIPCSNVQVIRSLINHLISCYEISGSAEQVNDLIKMKAVLK